MPTNSIPGGIFAVKALTNVIRNARDPISIKTAEAFENLANAGNILGQQISDLQAQISNLPVPPRPVDVTVPFVTPEDFGNIGVGDDTPFVQAAIDDGRAVMLSSQKTYQCTALLLRSNLVVFGLPGSTLRQLDGSAVDNTPFISSAGNINVYMEGVFVDANKSNNPGIVNVTGIEFLEPDGVVLKNCGVKGTSGDGIGGNGWRNVTIDTLTASDWGIGNGFAGIYNRFDGTRAARNISVLNPQMDGTGSGSCIKLTADTACHLSNARVVGGSVKVGFPASGPPDALAVEFYCNTDGNLVSDVLVDGVYIDSELATALTYGKSWGVSLSQVVRGQVVNCRVKNCGYFFIELIGSDLVAKNNRGQNVGTLAVIVSSVMSNDQAGIEVAGNTSVLRSGALPSSALAGVFVYIEGTANLSQVDVHDNYVVIQGLQYGYWIQNNGAAILLRPLLRFNQVLGDGTVGSYGYIVQNDSSGSIEQLEIRSNWGQSVQTFISRGSGCVNSRIIENIPGTGITTVYAGTPGTGEMIVDIANAEGTNFAPPSIQIRGRAAQVITEDGDLYLDKVADTSHLATAFPGVDVNPNPVYLNRVNFGSAVQGSYLSVNSYWTGSPNWALASTGAVSTRAMFIALAAQAFRVKFGDATNTGDADPGLDGLKILDSDAVYTGAGYPIELEVCGFRLRGYSGSNPNTNRVGNVGDLIQCSSGVWYKSSGTGTSTGWVKEVTADGAVTSLNTQVGPITLVPGTGITITPGSGTFTFAMTGVTSLNSITGAVTLAAGTGISLTPAGSTITVAATGGAGSVTSVGLSLPSSILAVSGSPVTTSGTLTGSLATQTANTVWAGPTSGGAATPTFRALVAADLPGAAGALAGFTPTMTASSGTVTIVASECAWQAQVLNPKQVLVRYTVQFTVSVTTAVVFMSLPVTPKSSLAQYSQCFAMSYQDSSLAPKTSWNAIEPAFSRVVMFLYSGNFVSGASHYVELSGVIEIA